MQTYKVSVDDQNTVRFYNEKGQLHRLDGPAVKYANGDELWYQNGQLHRLDGPAVKHADDYEAWYINGKNLTKAEFDAKTNASVSSVSSTCNGKVVEIHGKKYKLMEI